MRSSLIQAAQMSWLQPLDEPRRRFVVRTEAQLSNELTEAQKDAARIEPTLNRLGQVLEAGKEDRKKEIVPRWQAGYDLAIGRVLATRVRAEGYNVMLAQAKRGLKFGNPKNNTWQLDPSTDVSGGSRLKHEADQAREYLEGVTKDHVGTPWALLAKRELERPLGWKWREKFTPVDPPPVNQVASNSNSNSTPQDDRARVIKPPPKRRPPPRL